MAKDKKEKSQTLFWDEAESSEDQDTLVDLEEQESSSEEFDFQDSLVKELEQPEVPSRSWANELPLRSPISKS